MWHFGETTLSFAQSKTADHLRDEVNEKIEKAEDKIASLKGQLKVLRSV